MYTLKIYITKDGGEPFMNWLDAIKDMKARANIYSRLDRAVLGNFGDCKSLTNASGLWEMRVHYGGGYRIYYRVEDKKIILLLAGSSKKEQDKAIKKAEEYYKDYLKRDDL